MKKLRLFFYPFYFLCIASIFFLSINLFESISFFQRIGVIRYISDIPSLMRNVLLFLAVLMILEQLIGFVSTRLIKSHK